MDRGPGIAALRHCALSTAALCVACESCSAWYPTICRTIYLSIYLSIYLTCASRGTPSFALA